MVAMQCGSNFVSTLDPEVSGFPARFIPLFIRQAIHLMLAYQYRYLALGVRYRYSGNVTIVVLNVSPYHEGRRLINT
jgi:hypothetical protein